MREEKGWERITTGDVAKLGLVGEDSEKADVGLFKVGGCNHN